MDRLKLTDKIKSINSVLFMVIGIIIIVRSAALAAGIHIWLPLLVGISFIAFGIYRIRFVLKYLRGRQ
jgi:uncharacterized membrane protein HdeD (DUF308 family)